ncbi:MAG: hypothetical protein PHU12_04150 [Candidatus Aenigmarchaeota archaeon]|jgi:hypothetical protein|nr:hypothetical protein [Candidatus Aenigmarchaeota archaeon]
MICKNCRGRGTTTQYDDETGPVGICPACKGLVTVYRIWDATNEGYRFSNAGEPFYKDHTGAQLGIRRMKESYHLKDHTFEIREYIAMPTSLIQFIINWIDGADNETPFGDKDKKYILSHLRINND